LKVIICEDDLEQRQFLQNVIRRYSSFHLPSIEIALCASTPEEVISYIENHSAECYILDIELNSSINGLELARIIRKQDPLATIIFVTTFANKLKLTFKYKVAALDFIIKTSNQQLLANNIIEALTTAYQHYLTLGHNSSTKVLQIKVGENIKNIRYEDIYYFETSSIPHKIRVHSKNGIYEFYGKLKDLEKLDPRFCRSHNSYLINIDYLHEYDVKNKILIMENGHECLVSYRYAKNIVKHLV
jgi:two-component system, LytTR family, response regulator AgrA